MAVQSEFTAKPSIILSANMIIAALMINKNRPKETIVIGSVKMIKIGFKNAFRMASTAATIIAVVYGGFNSTPGNTFARIIIATALSMSFIRNFICLNFRL